MAVQQPHAPEKVRPGTPPAAGGTPVRPSVQVGGWWEGSEAKVSEIGEEERERKGERAAAPRPRGGGRRPRFGLSQGHPHTLD